MAEYDAVELTYDQTDKIWGAKVDTDLSGRHFWAWKLSEEWAKSATQSIDLYPGGHYTIYCGCNTATVTITCYTVWEDEAEPTLELLDGFGIRLARQTKSGVCSDPINGEQMSVSYAVTAGLYLIRLFNYGPRGNAFFDNIDYSEA